MCRLGGAANCIFLQLTSLPTGLSYRNDCSQLTSWLNLTLKVSELLCATHRDVLFSGSVRAHGLGLDCYQFVPR